MMTMAAILEPETLLVELEVVVDVVGVVVVTRELVVVVAGAVVGGVVVTVVVAVVVGAAVVAGVVAGSVVAVACAKAGAADNATTTMAAGSAVAIFPMVA